MNITLSFDPELKKQLDEKGPKNISKLIRELVSDYLNKNKLDDKSKVLSLENSIKSKIQDISQLENNVSIQKTELDNLLGEKEKLLKEIEMESQKRSKNAFMIPKWKEIFQTWIDNPDIFEYDISDTNIIKIAYAIQTNYEYPLNSSSYNQSPIPCKREEIDKNVRNLRRKIIEYDYLKSLEDKEKAQKWSKQSEYFRGKLDVTRVNIFKSITIEDIYDILKCLNISKIISQIDENFKQKDQEIVEFSDSVVSIVKQEVNPPPQPSEKEQEWLIITEQGVLIRDCDRDQLKKAIANNDIDAIEDIKEGVRRDDANTIKQLRDLGIDEENINKFMQSLKIDFPEI